MFAVIDSSAIRAGETDHFDKWVRTFTGMSFLVLGVSILKYGSQLETTITHSINLKSSMAAQMEGLDIRILSITILLSLVFLSRALVDCMFAFNLINDQLNSFVMLLCIIVFSEVLTSMAIVKLMKKGAKSSELADKQGLMGRQGSQLVGNLESDLLNKDNHFFAAGGQKVDHAGKKKRYSDERHNFRTNTRSDHRDHEDPSSHDHLDQSYTSYGSFNPNLESGAEAAGHVEVSPCKLLSQGRAHRKGKLSQNYCEFLAAQTHLNSAGLPINENGASVRTASASPSATKVKNVIE